MYEFQCYYVKSKYNEKAKLCYMDTDTFIVHVKTEDTYTDIAEDLQVMSQKEKFSSLMKDNLGGITMKKCVRLKHIAI